jgi:murein DD-endopeptidase MepM/ murein hydrolase activator NlpD
LILSCRTDIEDNGNGGYGNEIIIDHGDGTFTHYAHMEPSVDQNGRPLKDKNGNARVSLKVGDSVKAGDQIGTVGTTGNLSRDEHGDLKEGLDPHLHFEVLFNIKGKNVKKRTYINPSYILPPPSRD